MVASMEISSIGAALWTATQTITIAQVAPIVLVGIACLFAYTYWMNQAAAAASARSSIAGSPLPTPVPRSEPGGDDGAVGKPSEPTAVAPAVASPAKIATEDAVAAFTAHFAAEFEKVSQLSEESPLIKAFILSDLLPWMHMEVAGQDTDRAKFIEQIREMYDALLDKLPAAERADFEEMVARRAESDGERGTGLMSVQMVIAATPQLPYAFFWTRSS